MTIKTAKQPKQAGYKKPVSPTPSISVEAVLASKHPEIPTPPFDRSDEIESRTPHTSRVRTISDEELLQGTQQHDSPPEDPHGHLHVSLRKALSVRFNGKRIRFLGKPLMSLFKDGIEVESDCDIFLFHDAFLHRQPYELDAMLKRAFQDVRKGGELVMVERVSEYGRVGVYRGNMVWAGFRNVLVLGQWDEFVVICGVKP